MVLQRVIPHRVRRSRKAYAGQVLPGVWADQPPPRGRHTRIPRYEPPPELEPEPLPRPSRRERPRRRSFFRILLFILIVTGVALALPYATSLFATGRVMDGVSLGGQPIGGQGRDEIRRLLEQRYAAFIRSPLTISYEGRTWTPTLDQIGVRFDLDQIADDVLAAGHRGGPIERVEELWALWQGGLDVAPRISVDAGKLQAYLLNLAPEVERPSRDGSLSIAEGKVLPAAAQPGRQTLVDATAIDIVRALQNLEPAKVALRTRMLAPALSDDAVAHAADDARALLKGPLLLKRGPQTWSWDSDKIAEFLSIGAANGRHDRRHRPRSARQGGREAGADRRLAERRAAGRIPQG